MNYQPLYDIPELCAQHGITHAVHCPGSRCAPLAIGFSRHPKINVYTIPDERSAAYIALGIAEETRLPVVLICTSGTAALNFYPAIAEAYYQRVPLLILTADRPPEWIDQQDGQAIRQNFLFLAHVEKSYTFPVDFSHPDSVWHAQRITQEAILFSKNNNAPVHLNIPIREPFYPATVEETKPSTSLKIFSTPRIEKKIIDTSLLDSFQQYEKVLILIGQYSVNLNSLLQQVKEQQHIVIAGEITSNNTTNSHPEFILHEREPSFHPDLLITIGRSFLSKKVKNYFRKNAPKAHWHVDDSTQVVDIFQQLTMHIPVSAESFLQTLLTTAPNKNRIAFQKVWKEKEEKINHTLANVCEEKNWDEVSVVYHVLHHLPKDCTLHLANSMSVRYGQLVGLTQSVYVYSNRGTSGIDGCNSTAVGHALASEKPQLLITGDMAFIYDEHAFWHSYKLKNFHVLVLNNFGGLIFDLIDGPQALPEKSSRFITSNQASVELTAKKYGMAYHLLTSFDELSAVTEFTNQPTVFEVRCESEKTKAQYQRIVALF